MDRSKCFFLSKGYNTDDYDRFINFNISNRNRVYYSGYVYIIQLSNKNIKIGSTATVCKRMKALHHEYAKYHIGFICVLISRPMENYVEIETKLHNVFRKYRIPNTEEFSITVTKALHTLHEVLQKYAIFTTWDSIIKHFRDDLFSDIALFSLLAHKIDYNLMDSKKDYKHLFPKDIQQDIVECGYLDTVNSRFLALCKDGHYRDIDGFIVLVRKDDSYSIDELEQIRDKVILEARKVQQSMKNKRD